MENKIVAVGLIVAIVVSGGIGYFLAATNLRTSTSVVVVENHLVNGRFDDGVCFGPLSGVTITSNECTSVWWWVTTNYGNVSAMSLARVVNQTVLPGGRALEFKIEKVAGNLGVSAMQWLNESGCMAGAGRSFGLKVQKGLTFSFWSRGVNASRVTFGGAVVFHNGSSKLAIGYHLERSSIGGYKASGLPLSSRANEASVDVYLNSSAPVWKESSFDLYLEFVKYFGVDPISNHYCVDYVSVWLSQETSGPPKTNVPGSYAYCYFDDIELYVKG